MRNDLLFIDGELVDLDDNTKITLNYNSNIFTDLSKIVSNNSYTIKLPNTVRNQRIIEHADLPACDTDYPRRVHKARYFRNGIEILSNAQAVLMSVRDAIEIVLSWGNIVNFANIVNGGKKLTDLMQGTTENIDWAVWKNWGQNSELFPKVNYGFNDGDSNAWYHPVVTAKKVIGDIIYENDVIFDVPDDKFNLLDKIIVPLLTKNDSQALYDKHPISITGNSIRYDTTSYNSERCVDIHFNGDSSQRSYGEDANITGTNISGIGYRSLIDSEKTKLKGIVLIGTKNVGEDPWKSKLVIRANRENGERTYLSYILPTTVQKSDTLWNVGYNVDISFEINKNDILFLSYMPDVKPSILFAGDVAMVNLDLTVSPRGEVLFGEKFPFVPNLPDMKQIDFIKGIMSILGLFAIPQENNTIKFVSVDDITANKSKAVDWTKKVIASSCQNKPKSINYILDSFAHNNRFKWKEDNTVTGNYDGNIVINDNTIEYERDAIKLPFSACDTKNSIASIPMYSYNDKGELQYKKVNPRILLLEGTNGVFKGLEWETLLKNSYSTYKGMVSKPKVITENIEISDIELKNLDLAVPVYLGQHGRYYAIISIKAEDTGICESKLLQLEV